ncbi:PLDc N-terminal domain-containing protein [Limibacter armeniacum]|uniref:PLDc N-terminal domain-containing protein n=1 Tax=Limibacter armeniacum TaxID=466084 RepID=UPI0038CC1C4C
MSVVTPGIGLFFWVIVFFAFIPQIICLFSILNNEFKNNDKLVWALVVLFLPLIGPLFYLIIGRKQQVKKFQ